MNDFEVYIIVVLIWKEKERRAIEAQTASSRKEKLTYAHYCVTMCNNEEKNCQLSRLHSNATTADIYSYVQQQAERN